MAPDVLVLASGGTLGEAWMSGLLAGIEDATGHDFRATESLIGTSAGSLVAAALVAGERPRRPQGPSGRCSSRPARVPARTSRKESSSQLATWLPISRTALQGDRARGRPAGGRRGDAARADGAGRRIDGQHRRCAPRCSAARRARTSR